MKRITMTLAVVAIFIISAHGQGFQNLDFESAQNLPGNPGNGELVPATSALADWIAYNGDNVLANVYYTSNVIYGTAAAVGLEGGSLALSGDFSVELFLNGSISQTGLVPDSAESLQFEAEGPDGFLGASGFSVTLGGQSLSFSALSEGPDYTVYGANIPAAMDGQTEALTFFCEGPGSGNVLLDNIEFSTMSIPEPSEYALLGIGAMLFGLRRFRKGVSGNDTALSEISAKGH
jgi:hypothetical protein